jgi:hypothetical protein
MPPPPHCERVLQVLREGRAFIQERGHGIAPLLVFEGEGGVMELPKVRYLMTHRGMQLVAGDESASKDQTRHPDVCGCIDEFKGLVKDEADIAKLQPERLHLLLDDACRMITRMQRRCEHYQSFARDVAALGKRMAAIEQPNAEPAHHKAEELRQTLQDSTKTGTAKIDQMHALAEVIRDVANQLEGCLSSHKEPAMEVNRLCDQVKGGRSWTA